MTRQRSSVVISKRGLFSQRMIAVLLLIVLGLAAFAGYQAGLRRAGFKTFESARDINAAEEQVAALEEENKALSARIAVLDTAITVDREAYRQVEAQLVELQDKILAQQEDIDFYRAIVDEADGSILRIQNFTIKAGLRDNEYELRLVLAQALRSSSEVSGQVELAVEGLQRSEPVRLDLAELASDGDSATLSYSFRYFQDLKAAVTLPNGFSPERVHVLVRPRGAGAKTVEEFFVWSVDSG